MGTKNIRFTTTTLILCFFVISIVFLSSSPAVFGRNLSSSPKGSSGNSKIGVGPGHSSTAPSATGQSSPTKQSSSSSVAHRTATQHVVVCSPSISACRPP